MTSREAVTERQSESWFSCRTPNMDDVMRSNSQVSSEVTVGMGGEGRVGGGRWAVGGGAWGLGVAFGVWVQARQLANTHAQVFP